MQKNSCKFLSDPSILEPDGQIHLPFPVEPRKGHHPFVTAADTWESTTTHMRRHHQRDTNCAPVCKINPEVSVSLATLMLYSILSLSWTNSSSGDVTVCE